jgi:hypothetical protein
MNPFRNSTGLIFFETGILTLPAVAAALNPKHPEISVKAGNHRKCVR